MFALATCYAYQLGLPQQGWTIEVRILDLGSDSVAATSANPSYWQARIRLDSARIEKASDAVRREVAVHELLHIHLWESMELARKKDREQATRREEKVVTYLAQRPFWRHLCAWPTTP
jgi:hypothetical protein